MEIKDIRKSAFVTYRHCQKRFEFLYNDPNYWNYGVDKTMDENDPRALGNKFHDACEKWMKGLEGKTITKNFPRTWNNPFNVDDGIVFEWFNWFLEQETKRWIDLESDGNVGTWYPIANELEVKWKGLNEPIGMTGHVDRVDVLPDGSIQIVEYKAGKSYNMDNKYALTDMNQEIGFYAVLLRNSKAFGDRKIKSWKVINPLLGKIWENNISPATTKAVERTFNDMCEKITKGGTFEKDEGVQCDWCPYVEECLYGDKLIDFDEDLSK